MVDSLPKQLAQLNHSREQVWAEKGEVSLYVDREFSKCSVKVEMIKDENYMSIKHSHIMQ